MAVCIIPRAKRGRLYFQTADVLFSAFTPTAGQPRHGVESCCPAFVAKGGAR
jgi:hypothetical protein